MKTMQKIVLFAGLVLALLLGFAMGHFCADKRPGPEKAPIMSVDTLYIRDTIVEIRPVSVERRVIDTVLVPVVDTVRQKDTVFVRLEREQVEWSDSLCTVWASGVLPEVDSVRHYVPGMVIRETVPVVTTVRKRWGLGVQAGYGVTVDGGRVAGAPYIGVGVSYNILTW